MPIDYLKIYKQLMADVILVKVRPNLMPYIERLLQWESNQVFPYACTISPKSSPLLRNKPLSIQYGILAAYIKQTMPLYSNKYFFTFETYSDNVNLHIHGFVNFRTLEDIRKFKRENRQMFNITLKPKQKDCLTHVKLIGNDETLRQRWIGYCYKEMAWSIKSDIPPVYRWDDAYVKPIQHPNKKKKNIVKYESLPFVRSFEEHPLRKEYLEWKKKQPLMFHYNNTELEEAEESSEEDYSDYTLYLNLKQKYEKNL